MGTLCISLENSEKKKQALYIMNSSHYNNYRNLILIQSL